MKFRFVKNAYPLTRALRVDLLLLYSDDYQRHIVGNIHLMTITELEDFVQGAEAELGGK